MFFEDNKANIVRGSEGVVDFSSLFDNAINQKDSFIPFQDSKVSIFWFLIMTVRSWSVLRGPTGVGRAPKLDKTPNTAAHCRCRRRNLFLQNQGKT